MDDLSIIELYFARDEQAIKETDAKYGKLCHSIAYNILNNNEDSEECVNDTYIGVWNAIPPTRPNNFTAFLCKITRNISLKRIEAMARQKRSQATIVSLDELAEILPDESIGENISNDNLTELISDFLRKEKADVRNVFIRKYYFFDSVGDIAKRYDFTEDKVKSMFKVLTDELIIRRYLECTNIKVGDTVAVKFQTEIVLGEDNTVGGAISMYKGKVTDSGMAVPE